MNRTNGLLPFPFPADQNEGPLVGSTDIPTVPIPPAADTQTLSLIQQLPRISALPCCCRRPCLSCSSGCCKPPPLACTNIHPPTPPQVPPVTSLRQPNLPHNWPLDPPVSHCFPQREMETQTHSPTSPSMCRPPPPPPPSWNPSSFCCQMEVKRDF